jgi:hypothetical protein
MRYIPKALPYNISRYDAITFYEKEKYLCEKALKEEPGNEYFKDCLNTITVMLIELRKSDAEIVNRLEI